MAVSGALSGSFDQNAGVIFVILACALVALALWVALLHVRQRQFEAHFDSILGGVSGQNAVQMLTEYLGTVRSTAAAVQRMKEQHDRLAALMPSVVRHVGLVRFSPFHDTGGDQSFALALLDGEGDGVIVTGLHSRNDSRLYAKPVERGASPYSLTPEEREAMERAFGGKQGVPTTPPAPRR